MSRPKPMSVVDQIFAKATPAPATPLAGTPALPARPVAPAPEVEPTSPAKKADPLPQPGDAYRASAQFMSRLGTGERMIDFVDSECFSESFSYADLRRMSWRKPATPGGGPIMVVHFTSADVEIHGKHLDEIRHYIREGMMPWVWEQPAGYRPKSDRTTVITRIEIKEIAE